MPKSFVMDLAALPRKTQRSWGKTVFLRLQEAPHVPDLPAIKKLDGWRNLWRYRVGNYRFIYRLDMDSKLVTMLMVGPRSNIYDRLGHIPDKGPTLRIVADENMDPEVERIPNDRERAEAIARAPTEEPLPSPAPDPDQPLPHRLTPEILTDLSIKGDCHDVLCQLETEGDLMSAEAKGIPIEFIQRVLEYFWPQPLEEVINQPARLVENPDDIDLVINGGKNLEDFLLSLDAEQKLLVDRFKSTESTGPWMIKGGPGSGKSTVCLYCIKEIIDPKQSELALNSQPVSILLTTYTKSLIAASSHLLDSICKNSNQPKVTISHIDQLAYRYLSNQLRRGRPVRKQNRLEILKPALDRCKERDKEFSFSMTDDEFLLDEIEWVIIGEGLSTVDDYLGVDRSGRGRGLGRGQREQLWTLYLEVRKELRKQNRFSFAERIVEASQNAKPIYDYVFIDEAQDLAPSAIRFCLKLAKDPKNIFVTADPNQTIYGSNMPWKRISEDLNFQGRSRIFKRNYRTTFETWEAIKPIVEDIQLADPETLHDEPVYHGDLPVLGYYDTRGEEAAKIGEWLTAALLEEKLPSSCGAILCPTNDDCDRIASSLPSALNAKAMPTNSLDLAYRGVKVMTMYAAKGLQFPVVAVTGLDDGKIPRKATGGMDAEENDWKFRRLFFVACSRSMRRLLVMGNRNRPSPFLDSLVSDQWLDLVDELA